MAALKEVQYECTFALESKYTLYSCSDLPLDSMLNISKINGYNCIVIVYIIETMLVSYHRGCLLSAPTPT